jgi:gas vesicle protein
MGREDGNGNTVIGFGIGLVAGAVFGVGVGLLMATEEGQARRRDMATRATRLKDTSAGEVDAVVGELASRGKEVAQRFRAAAAAGLREARKHAVAPRDPRNADLAGVEGTVEGIAGV